MDVAAYSLQERLRIPEGARGCELMYVPHYNAPVLSMGPRGVTIHGQMHLTDPSHRNTSKAWGYARSMLKIAGAKASRIITVLLCRSFCGARLWSASASSPKR